MIRRLSCSCGFNHLGWGFRSFRPAQSAVRPVQADHAAWLTQVLGKMSDHKPGMTRWDVLMSSGRRRRATTVQDGRRLPAGYHENILSVRTALFQN